MSQASFAHSPQPPGRPGPIYPANDSAGLTLALSIFADRAHLRGEMLDDAQAAGFRIGQLGELADLIEADGAVDPRPLGDVVLIDCPVVDMAAIAALVRLDLRAAHCGAQLVVSTSVAALDDVFACMDQSAPQILVDAGRADRVIALGRVLARVPSLRVRELAEEDRLMLLRLTEQVAGIAQRLERFGTDTPEPWPMIPASPIAGDDSAFAFEAPHRAYRIVEDAGAVGCHTRLRATRAPLPDPKLVRRIIRQRQMRAQFFDGELFADPAWDMLLDLTAARAEHVRVSVTSLCIASGVPPTTALRWIGQMTDAGLFQRVEDDADRRRAFIALSDRAADGMARYFAELGASEAKYLV